MGTAGVTTLAQLTFDLSNFCESSTLCPGVSGFGALEDWKVGGSGFCLLVDLDLDLELDRDRDLDLSRCLVWESGCVSVRVGHEFRSASSELNHLGGAGSFCFAASILDCRCFPVLSERLLVGFSLFLHSRSPVKCPSLHALHMGAHS